MSNFQAIEIIMDGKIKYGIAKLPDRKRVCIYSKNNNIIESIATFKKEEDATDFIEWLEELINKVNA